MSAIKTMDPEAHKEGLGQIWDGDNNVKKRIMDHRPATAQSLHSEGAPEDEIDHLVNDYHDKHHGVDLDEEVSVTRCAHEQTIARKIKLQNDRRGLCSQVDVLDGKFVIDGIPINMVEVIRDKIYRKRGGVNQLRRAFMELDRDGSGTINRRKSLTHARAATLRMPPTAASSDCLLSVCACCRCIYSRSSVPETSLLLPLAVEFRDFLAPYNLNLSPQALALCVVMFDTDGSRCIDFNEFCRKVMPDDYTYITDGRGNRKMQGVPSIVINRGRRVVKPLQPKMVGPFESKSSVPAPDEPRAVQHIREKVEQRTRNSNDKKPELQLRDALLLHDHHKDGKISQVSLQMCGSSRSV